MLYFFAILSLFFSSTLAQSNDGWLGSFTPTDMPTMTPGASEPDVPEPAEPEPADTTRPAEASVVVEVTMNADGVTSQTQGQVCDSVSSELGGFTVDCVLIPMDGKRRALQSAEPESSPGVLTVDVGFADMTTASAAMDTVGGEEFTDSLILPPGVTVSDATAATIDDASLTPSFTPSEIPTRFPTEPVAPAPAADDAATTEEAAPIDDVSNIEETVFSFTPSFTPSEIPTRFPTEPVATTAPEPADCDDTLEQCCSYTEDYGLVPYVTWGSTPRDGRQWWDANNCNSLVGGSSLSNCPYACDSFAADVTEEPGSAEPVQYRLANQWQNCANSGMEPVPYADCNTAIQAVIAYYSDISLNLGGPGNWGHRGSGECFCDTDWDNCHPQWPNASPNQNPNKGQIRPVCQTTASAMNLRQQSLKYTATSLIELPFVQDARYAFALVGFAACVYFILNMIQHMKQDKTWTAIADVNEEL